MTSKLSQSLHQAADLDDPNLKFADECSRSQGLRIGQRGQQSLWAPILQKPQCIAFLLLYAFILPCEAKQKPEPTFNLMGEFVPRLCTIINDQLTSRKESKLCRNASTEDVISS